MRSANSELTTKVSAQSGRTVLPLKGLLIALSVQLPLVLATLPLRPHAAELAAGALLMVAGIAINAWSERQFRRAGVGVYPFSPVPAVVNTGPYRFTRNAMYLGLIAINEAAVLLNGVALNTWTTVLFAVWLHRRFVVPEEQFLPHVCGESSEDSWLLPTCNRPYDAKLPSRLAYFSGSNPSRVSGKHWRSERKQCPSAGYYFTWLF